MTFDQWMVVLAFAVSVMSLGTAMIISLVRPNKERKIKMDVTLTEAMAMEHEMEERVDKAFRRGREFERDRIVNILMKDDTTAKLELILGTFWSTDDDN